MNRVSYSAGVEADMKQRWSVIGLVAMPLGGRSAVVADPMTYL